MTNHGLGYSEDEMLHSPPMTERERMEDARFYVEAFLVEKEISLEGKIDYEVSLEEAIKDNLTPDSLMARGMEPNCDYENCKSNWKKVPCFYDGKGCAIARGFQLVEQEEAPRTVPGAVWYKTEHWWKIIELEKKRLQELNDGVRGGRH